MATSNIIGDIAMAIIADQAPFERGLDDVRLTGERFASSNAVKIPIAWDYSQMPDKAELNRMMAGGVDAKSLGIGPQMMTGAGALSAGFSAWQQTISEKTREQSQTTKNISDILKERETREMEILASKQQEADIAAAFARRKDISDAMVTERKVIAAQQEAAQHAQNEARRESELDQAVMAMRSNISNYARTTAAAPGRVMPMDFDRRTMAGATSVSMPGASMTTITNIDRYMASANVQTSQMHSKMEGIGRAALIVSGNWDSTSIQMYKATRAAETLLTSFSGLAKYAGVAGALMAGWSVGRLIGEMTGLDQMTQRWMSNTGWISKLSNMGIQTELTDEDKGRIAAGESARMKREQESIAKGIKPYSESDALSDVSRRKANEAADKQKAFLEAQKALTKERLDIELQEAGVAKQYELIMARRMEAELKLAEMKAADRKAGVTNNADTTKAELDVIRLQHDEREARKRGADERKTLLERAAQIEKNLYWEGEQDKEDAAKKELEQKQKTFAYTDAAGFLKAAQAESGKVLGEEKETVAERKRRELLDEQLKELKQINAKTNGSVFTGY